MNSTKYLNDQEAEALETFLKARIKEHPRDTLLLLLTLKTGARASEVLRVRRGDLNTFNKSVFIRGLKGSNDREIPLNAALFKELNEYTIAMKDEEQIFPITYNTMVKVWYKWRQTKKKLHSLRHTNLLKVYKKSKDINLVMQVSGHRSYNSVRTYQTYCYTQTELRRILK